MISAAESDGSVPPLPDIGAAGFPAEKMADATDSAVSRSANRSADGVNSRVGIKSGIPQVIIK